MTPTDPNITRLRPIRFDEDTLEIPVWQGILRHGSAPGVAIVLLEQNPAYEMALTFMYANYARCQGASTLTLTRTGAQER